MEPEHSFEAPDGATPPGPGPAGDGVSDGAEATRPAPAGAGAPDPMAPGPLPPRDDAHHAMVPPRWPDAAPRAPRAPRGIVREPLRPAWHEWRRRGLRTGAVATAATAGVLVHFGLASGVGPLGAFTQVGRLVVGIARTDGALAHGAAAVVGLMVHALVVTSWSVAYARVVTGWGALGRWVAAVAVAGLAWVAGQLFLPTMLRFGHGVRALAPQVLLLHVVLALSLVIGMRLALEADDEL